MVKLVLKIAFLSLLRNPLRTLLVTIMISISLWGLIFMQGVYDGMVEGMINNAIKSDCGQISLFKKGYRQNRDIKYLIDEDVEVMLNSQNIKYLKRVISDALIATSKYSQNAKIYGINLEKEKQIALLDRYIIKGKYSFKKRQKGAIVGYSLAKKLKLKIGSKIILSAQNIDNEVVSIALRVKAIIKTNNIYFDKQGVFIDIDRTKKFLEIKNRVTQISLHLNQDIKTTQTNLQKSFKELEIFRWDEMYPALLQSREFMKMFNYISFGLIFFIATIGIFGVILVSVLERLKEFAILQAIGSNFKTISLMIFFEAFFIGVIGFIIGSIISYLTLLYFNIYGLDLSSFSDAFDEFGMDAITYAIISVDYFIMGFVSVILATLLSIIIPLKILKNKNPIRVING